MYTDLIIQDGLFVTQCIQWGFSAAPKHYQEVMNRALDAPCIDATGNQVPPAQHAMYFDDVFMGADNVEECWHNMAIIIVHLALRNLPIGIWKRTFFTRALLVVGAMICGGEYQLVAKPIHKLFASTLPRSMSQL